ncbi:MAG: hypothetical protein KBD44_02140 [Candidatus Pacebacteria bacterium]|nr:hypothetical protein [Candidatus Paceibacterota bacterium]
MIKFPFLLTILLFVMSLPVLVFAQPAPDPIKVSLQNPLRMDSLEEFLIAILNLIMVLMVPVIIFFIIYAGFKYVTARGNPGTISEATKALTYAVIGAVIILGAVAISQMIKSTVDEFRVDTANSTELTISNYV